MTGATVGADNTLLFGFGKNVHHAFVALGPIALGKAMHQHDVEIIGAEFFAEAVEIGAHFSGIARPRFGKHRNFVTRNMLERLSNMRMASIRVSRVEETESVVIAIEQQIGESFDAKRGLVGMMSTANGSGPHRQTAGVNAGPAENDGV